MKPTKFYLISLFMFFSSYGFAQSLQCDSDQKYCLSEDKRITYGDHVAIFNTEEEVVALAKVSQLANSTRRLEIVRRMAPIAAGYSVRLISDEEFESIEKYYAVYRQPASRKIGGSLGVVSINLAEDTDAYAADGYIDQKWDHGISLVGRLMWMTAKGRAIDVEDANRKHSYEAHSFSVLPGIAYEVFPKHMFSVRGELNLGFSYMDMSVAASKTPRALEKVDADFDLAARAGVSLIFNNLGRFHPELTISSNKIIEARATYIAFGLSSEI